MAAYFKPGQTVSLMKKALVPTLILYTSVLWVNTAYTHGGHSDPEVIGSLPDFTHLTIQWVHLTAFAFWLGSAAASLVFAKYDLVRTLFFTYIFFLLLFVTGSYNMENSTGIPGQPSILLLGLVSRYHFGSSYTIFMGLKQAFYWLTVAITVVVTFLHLKRPSGYDNSHLCKRYLLLSVTFGVLITATTAITLMLHEAADLSPTPVHSLGGVVGPRGPDELSGVQAAMKDPPSPYRDQNLKSISAGFKLISNPQVTLDIFSRFLHLLTFALWFGGTLTAITYDKIDKRRFILYTWVLLTLLVLTGIYEMAFWTPFGRSPYIFRLKEMYSFRVGRTYTLLISLKHALVILILLLTAFMNMRNNRKGKEKGILTVVDRRILILNLLLGLSIAYITIMVLLVHEVVDHAL